MSILDEFLPRIDVENHEYEIQENQTIYEHDGNRMRLPNRGNRLVRDLMFRKTVLGVYDERCAITGLKLINGGGRAEVQAAHIKPVKDNGPDSIQNGIALSGTVHWMFDRGLISLEDDLKIIVSRHVNDRESIDGLINPSGFANAPQDNRFIPLPKYLKWHRDNCLKN